MKISDVDRNVNSYGQFKIEIDGAWITVDAYDFFDYLANTGRIDGHDPEQRIAWTEYDAGYYDNQRGDWVDNFRYQTRRYDQWIAEIEDEELIAYIKTLQAVEKLAA